jgi:hypothetical protein
MAKTKHKTLFNKNHISFDWYDTDIVRQAYIDFEKKHNTTKSVQNYNPYTSGWKTPKYEIVRTKSPLGFYYDKRVLVNKTQEKNTQTNTCMKIWTFYIGNRIYKLSYYIEYNGTHINQEIRPWDICEGDKSMPDHYVNALLSELNNMFSDISVLKNKDIRDTSSNEKDTNSWNRYYTFNIKDNTKKREIFTDLFGYPEGPKYQTNEEKILSHGFDLKTSFRKM